VRATRIASFVGQGVAVLFIFWGASQLLGGNFIGGLWIAFIGWFLNGAAESARQQVQSREVLRGLRVSELMDPNPDVASPSMSAEEFVFEHVVRRGRRALPVIENGRLVGIVSITDAKKVPRPAWPSTPVAQIMTPVPLQTVGPTTDIAVALKLLVHGTLNQLPVAEGDRLVGLLSRSDILRYLQFRQTTRVPEPSQASR
jgi:CBS domain-containing protein